MVNGIQILGTVDVLIRAKELNYIPSLMPLMETLVENGIRIGKNLYETSLKISKEF